MHYPFITAKQCNRRTSHCSRLGDFFFFCCLFLSLANVSQYRHLNSTFQKQPELQKSQARQSLLAEQITVSMKPKGWVGYLVGLGFVSVFLYHLPASSTELLRNKTFLLNQIPIINLDRECLNQDYLHMIYEGRYFST